MQSLVIFVVLILGAGLAETRDRQRYGQDANKVISNLQLLIPPSQPDPDRYAPFTPLLIERENSGPQDYNLPDQRERDLALLQEYSQSDLDLTQLVPMVVDDWRASGRASFKTDAAWGGDGFEELPVAMVPEENQLPKPQRSNLALREACTTAANKLPTSISLPICRLYLAELVKMPTLASDHQHHHTHDNDDYEGCGFCALLQHLAPRDSMVRLFGPMNGRRVSDVLIEESPGLISKVVKAAKAHV